MIETMFQPKTSLYTILKLKSIGIDEFDQLIYCLTIYGIEI